uniref:Tetratricopeptide repeat-containing protein n=1 Tax=Candidatus Kentrum sp. DK TaxID=2126562 RepID=A0A450SXR6_9GAMM|nr:MAG: Tetratricopeptide repeat-containing protein [Candidatus Kentron sp. DK]
MAMSALHTTIFLGLCMLALIGSPAKAANDAADLGNVRSLAETGKYQEAMKQVDKYLKQNPGDAEARFLKGIMLSDQKRFDEAIEVFIALTEDYPQLPEPYNNLAVLYASRGNYRKARDSLLIAIKTHPSYATAHENLGDIYAMMATEAYNKALELDKENQSAKVKLGMIRELFPEQATASGDSSDRRAIPESSGPVIAGREKPDITMATTAPTASSRSPSPPMPEDVKRDVLAALNAWAEAWSNKDVSGYLAAYAPTFVPSNGKSLSAWKRQRRSRILAPAYIDVVITEPRVVMLDNDRARISFTQKYRSNTYQDVTRKIIDLAPIAGKWRFIREEVK